MSHTIARSKNDSQDIHDQETDQPPPNDSLAANTSFESEIRESKDCAVDQDQDHDLTAKSGLTSATLEEHEKTVLINDGMSSLMWWGEYHLDINQMARWRVGPSTITVQRLEQEWRVVHYQRHKLFDNAISVEISLTGLAFDSVKGNLRRYMFGSTTELLSLTPGLADRPIVVRPETPLAVQADQEVTLYVTTPVWLRVAVGEERMVLWDIPTYRPSDTWFGNHIRSGELCYASPLAGVLSLKGIQRRPYRVVSPVRVVNRDKHPLVISQIKLPLEYVALYAADDNFLWTQAMTLLHEEDHTHLRVQRNAPREMGPGQQISPPHKRASRNSVIRAFERLGRYEREELG